ncbi:MAG: hypothetical protein WA792_10575 [Pseudolabrys sp.]|jgi:hypothetical protein
MGGPHPTPRPHEHIVERSLAAPPQSDDEPQNVSALIEENAQLRELVIQLSKLVIRNVVDRK